MRGTVEVAENLILDNGRPEFGPLKTKASHRIVPVPRQTLAALEDHVEGFGVGRDDLVSTSVAGSILRACQFRRRHFHPAAELSGLAPLRPHDLRHSAISLWIASGANPKVVQAKADHASIKVTYDRYGHLFPDYDNKATRHLEASGTRPLRKPTSSPSGHARTPASSAPRPGRSAQVTAERSR
ncbi:MAG: site-specific integrase [Actinomycetota bacterium]|nr:site-specific integrase [Actinomycetota bacterium]